MHKKGVGPGCTPASGEPFGTPNGAPKHQNLLKIEQNSENSRKIQEKKQKVIFLKMQYLPSKNHDFRGPEGPKISKNQEKREKRSTGSKNMLKKRMRKKDTKKGAGPARTSAHLSAPQIPCLSLPGLGKGGLGWLGWAGWAGLPGLAGQLIFH